MRYHTHLWKVHGRDWLEENHQSITFLQMKKLLEADDSTKLTIALIKQK